MANPATNGANTSDADLDVIVVGAGFAGLYQLRRLRELGYRVKVIEAGSDIGGIWHWNCYPGARVDTYGSIYQYSDPELWKDWDYSETYPGWDELREYFDYVDKKLDLRKDVILNTRVTGANFDEDKNVWQVKTDDGKTTTAQFFVLCTGFAAKAHIPDIEGLDSFKGAKHHTGLWPQEGLDFTGKRVAVIGTGSSGVQVVQEAAKTASELTLFQRTPNLTLPMGQHTISKEESAKLKEDYPRLFARRAETFAGFDFDFLDKGALEVSEQERYDTYMRLWKEGSFIWWIGTFNDVLFNQEANDTQYAFWRDETRKRISDPVLKEKFAPMTAFHPWGVKRPALEQGFYECFDQDNVHLVDIRETPIERFTETGITTSTDHMDFDIIVLATGFDSVSGGLMQIDITGTKGKSLADKWKEGLRAHIGMACSDFPNLIFVYGPQSPSAFCNGPSCAELQGEWVVQFVDDMRKRGVSRVEATTEAEESWRESVLEMTDATLFPKGNSWYMGANIPGKPRELVAYPGGLNDYLAKLKDCAENNYTGFELK